MESSRKISSLIVLVFTALAPAALAQETGFPESDPAELYGYEIDARETNSTRIAERALQAIKRARETAEEVKMTYGANKFRFITLKQESLKLIAAELSKHDGDIMRLRTAMESSSLFHTAMRSEGIAIRDVVAAELSDSDSGLGAEKHVTIYLAQQ